MLVVTVEMVDKFGYNLETESAGFTTLTHMRFVTRGDEELVWNLGLAGSFPCMMLFIEGESWPPLPP